jgi:beta-xylosidase
VDLQVSHIDPGHIVGPEGRRYLMLSGGHLVPLTDDGLATDGEPEKVYDGWPLPEDWVIECFALESPKFTFVDGWYYLTVAEGGTAGPATSHSVVQSRSRTPWGPWEHNPHNPLVHTSSREERWWSRGHGTLVDTPDGRWYVMYHAYEKDYHTLGRQTLLEPLERTDDGWFRPVDDLDIAGPIPVPPGEAVEHGLALSDDLCGTEPGLQWRFQEPSPWTHERPGMQRVNCTPEGLQMQAEGTCPADSRPMLCIPVDRAYEVSVEVEATAGCTPALMLYYSPECYTALCAATDEQGSPEVRLWRRNRPFGSERCAAPARALRITNDHHEIRFGYDAGDGWKTIQRAIQTDGYHHNVFGGFISLRAGLGTFGEGAARFRSFRYRAL